LKGNKHIANNTLLSQACEQENIKSKSGLTDKRLSSTLALTKKMICIVQ